MIFWPTNKLGTSQFFMALIIVIRFLTCCCFCWLGKRHIPVHCSGCTCPRVESVPGSSAPCPGRGFDSGGHHSGHGPPVGKKWRHVTLGNEPQGCQVTNSGLTTIQYNTENFYSAGILGTAKFKGASSQNPSNRKLKSRGKPYSSSRDQEINWLRRIC